MDPIWLLLFRCASISYTLGSPKCILGQTLCIQVQNIFVSNFKMYLSQIAHLTNLSFPFPPCFPSFSSHSLSTTVYKSQNVFVSNFKIYLSQISKCICLLYIFLSVQNGLRWKPIFWWAFVSSPSFSQLVSQIYFALWDKYILKF